MKELYGVRLYIIKSKQLIIYGLYFIVLRCLKYFQLMENRIFITHQALMEIMDGTSFTKHSKCGHVIKQYFNIITMCYFIIFLNLF